MSPPTSSTRTDILSLLAELVAFRTDVDEGDERALAEHLASLLRSRDADEVAVSSAPRAHGKASSWVYARFGTPRLLVNAHLDTVPPNTDWSSDPFVARVEGDRLYGLGSADTKGAAAAILCALEEVRPKDVAILFSGDEEYSGVSIREFCASERARGLTRAIVCEPTGLQAGVRHRGIVSFEVDVASPGGHSSLADVVPSPIGQLSELAVALDAWGRARRGSGPPGFQGMCLNLAKMDGGVAFNVIPAHGKLTVSLRPPPGADTAAIRRDLSAVVHRILPDAALRFTRDNAPFATRDVAAFAPLLGPGIVQAPIDLGFWTEAAVLAAAGIDAVVFGPGDIARAHGPNEWVPIAELHRAQAIFAEAFRGTTR